MRFRIVAEQLVVTTVILPAVSRREAERIVLESRVELIEDCCSQTWEEPRIRSVEELGE